MSDIYGPREMAASLRAMAETIRNFTGPPEMEPGFNDYELDEFADAIERLLADRLKMLSYKKLWERQSGIVDDDPCPRCDGEGTVCVCPDDICQGRGECIHGDGDVVCDECNGRYSDA